MLTKPLFHYLGILLALLLLTSAGKCGKKRAPDAYSPPRSVRSDAFLMEKAQFEPDKRLKSLRLRATLAGASEAESLEATANIIWLRDSAIWISVKKFGIEGARLLITPDSVWFINRLDQRYDVWSLHAVMQQYGAPGQFDLLQNLLIGSAWFVPGLPLKADTLGGLHRLRGENGSVRVEYGIQEDVFRWRAGDFLEKNDQNRLRLSFDQYKKVEFIGLFPLFRQVDAYSKTFGRLTMDITFTEVLPNGAETYRFEVPEHYQRTGK